MARIWIEPPYFIALVCGVYVRVDFVHLDQWKEKEESMETERE